MFDTLDQVLARINEGERFLVIGHVRPDGDDVSSVASLVMILRKAGKVAEGCIADDASPFLERLDRDSIIKTPDALGEYAYDTAITVDASELARIGESAGLLEGRAPDITLDHHKSNPGFGKVNFCDPAYAATAMIIYEIGERLVEFDPALAEMILLGIATDTGFFRYASVDERVFSYAARLVREGANIGRVTEAVLEHRTLNEIRLLTEMLDTLELSADGRLATAYVTAEMMKRTGCTDDDTSGLIGEIRSIAGVEVAIVFIESGEGPVHVSLRSKNAVDVSEIALQFNGGGHARAAGCSCTDCRLEDLMGSMKASAEQAISTSFGGALNANQDESTTAV
jgi:phosphoesterase RecJ-like protein